MTDVSQDLSLGQQEEYQSIEIRLTDLDLLEPNGSKETLWHLGNFPDLEVTEAAITFHDVKSAGQETFPDGDLSGEGGVVIIVSDYTANVSDQFILADAAAGNITVTLPAATAQTGNTIYVKKTDTSNNTVTIDGAASDVIDDETTAVLGAQYADVTAVSDGTEWWAIGTPLYYASNTATTRNTGMPHVLVQQASTGDAAYALITQAQEWNLKIDGDGGQRVQLEDVTNSEIPFAIEVGATSNTLYLDSNSNVGAGTASPLSRIHAFHATDDVIILAQTGKVAGTAETRYANLTDIWDVGVNGLGDYQVADVVAGTIPFYIESLAATSALYVDAASNVGVGTASPATNLHVLDATGDVTLRVETDKVNGEARFELINDARTYRLRVDVQDNFHIRDATLGTNVLVIEAGSPSEMVYVDSTGLLGVKTSTPVSTLEVAGSFGSLVAEIDDTDSPYTAGAVATVIGDTDAGDITVNLPALSGVLGREYSFKNDGTGTMTLDGSGAETVEGATTQDIASGDSWRIKATSTEWKLV